MREAFLAVCALFLSSNIALTSRQAVHAHGLGVVADEVVVAAAGLGEDLLDAAATLDFHGLPPGGSPPARFAEARSLDDLDALSATPALPSPSGSPDLTATAGVETMRKEGEECAPSPGAPYKRVRIVVEGPVGVRAVLERIYTEQPRD